MKAGHIWVLIGWAAKLFVGGFFFWASLNKLVDPQAFAEEISNYQFWPEVAPYVASTLPTLELLVGLMLIILPLPISWLTAANLVTAGLMCVFSVAVSQALIRGIQIDCGCFGVESDPITFYKLLRNLGLLTLCGVIQLAIGKSLPTTGPS